MQKKTKRMIILTILLLIILTIILLIINTTKPMPQVITEQAKAEYTTQIGEQIYDITNAVLEPSNITPTVSAGMIPIKWNGTNWVITTLEDKDWYNYSNGKPAYIMLNDGYYQSELIKDMSNKELAETAVGVGVPDDPNKCGSIYMWIPRFAYNNQGEILYIKQAHSVAGTYTMPEIFTYETEKMDFSLAGIWVELESTSTVNTKVNNMTGENNQYGFIANTIVTNANNETSYKTTIETYINALSTYTNETDANLVGVGVPDDPASEKYPNTVEESIARPQIGDISNPNRTILKITNSNQLEPIKANAHYDETEEKIKIEVTYRTNAIIKILNSKGNVLSENSLTADTGDEIIGNGTYRYIVIDNFGNIKEVLTKITGLKIYIIPDLETLKEFRDEVNSGNNFEGITVIQTADIQMNEGKYIIDDTTGDITFAEDAEQWIPIGDYASSNELKFCGVYQGNGYSVSGIYIDNNNDNQGLFGFAENAIIQDLGVINTYIKGNSSVGGILSYSKGTTLIENCYNKATINASDEKVGGLVGDAYEDMGRQQIRIINSYNKGHVIGNSKVGGIVGNTFCAEINGCYNDGDVVGNSNVGGVAGLAGNNCYITNSYNTKDINVIGDYVGGIVGKYTGNSICDSYNIGNISGNNNVGGIFGNGSGTVDKCYNNGNISGNNFVGGIAGYISDAGSVMKSYNSANVEGTDDYVGGIVGFIMNGSRIENVYNNGKISGKTYVAGIAGAYRWTSYLKNSYNIGEIKGGSYVGGIIGNGYGRYERNNYKKAYIDYCYNSGKINGEIQYVGGIIGSDSPTGYIYLTNNYNSGEIASGPTYRGGIIGYKYSSINISSSYFLINSAKYGIGGDTTDNGSNTGTNLTTTEMDLSQMPTILSIVNTSNEFVEDLRRNK